MKALFSALLAGLIFGVGLCISGMADPKNVLAFLDITGAWSPNLAGVMLGAVAVHALWLRWSKPANDTASATGKRPIDKALLAGSALFGVGWGLAGYCPGPSLVALGSGALGVFAFLAAGALGMALHHALTTKRNLS